MQGQFVCLNPNHSEQVHSRYYDKMTSSGFCPHCPYGAGILVQSTGAAVFASSIQSVQAVPTAPVAAASPLVPTATKTPPSPYSINMPHEPAAGPIVLPAPQHAKPPSVLWGAAAFFGLSFAVALFWPRVIFFGGGPYVFISIVFILEMILHITFAHGVSVLKSWAWPFGIWLNIANIVISIIVYAEGYDMLLSALISAIFIGWLANSNVRKALNQP